MDRRNFMKGSSALLAGAAIGIPLSKRHKVEIRYPWMKDLVWNGHVERSGPDATFQLTVRFDFFGNPKTYETTWIFPFQALKDAARGGSAAFKGKILHNDGELFSYPFRVEGMGDLLLIGEDRKGCYQPVHMKIEGLEDFLG